MTEATERSAESRETDEQRFARWLAEHGRALRRVAQTYEADPGRQEDLFQDICLALWRALPSFRGDASDRTFVFRVAHNRGLSHGWRQGKRKPLGALDLDGLDEAGRGDLLADHRSDPEAEVLADDRRRRLRAAVRKLPAISRQVLTLRLEGLSHREIAEVVGLSENNVAVRLSRARSRLQALLTEDLPSEGDRS